jgi:hypothetical protein
MDGAFAHNDNVTISAHLWGAEMTPKQRKELTLTLKEFINEHWPVDKSDLGNDITEYETGKPLYSCREHALVPALLNAVSRQRDGLSWLRSRNRPWGEPA